MTGEWWKVQKENNSWVSKRIKRGNDTKDEVPDKFVTEREIAFCVI